MTSPITREWVGLKTFALATQTKLLELLGRLEEKVPFFVFKFTYAKHMQTIIFIIQKCLFV